MLELTRKIGFSGTLVKKQVWKVSVEIALSVAVLLVLFIILLIIHRTPSGRGTVRDILHLRSRADSPKRQVLLWTQQRAGSTLTGKLLSAPSCSFVTMEPLRRHAEEGSSLLKDILRCRFSQRMNYFREWVTGPQVNDMRVKAMCEAYPSLCEDPAYTEAVCQAACANVVKVATVELGVATLLMHDPSLQVKVIHLVRDPRALLASRYEVELGKIISKVNGTFFTPEQKNATTVCHRYRQDLAAARFLRRQYPHRYTLLRYEDLALDPPRQVRGLYAFLDLPYTARVAYAVAKHTLGLFVYYYQVDPYSTYKNSTATVFEWRKRLAFEEVERIQQECGDVLRAYGYQIYPSSLQYDDPETSPLLSLTPRDVEP